MSFKAKSIVKAKQKQVSHNFSILFNGEISRRREHFSEFGKVAVIFDISI